MGNCVRLASLVAKKLKENNKTLQGDSELRQMAVFFVQFISTDLGRLLVYAFYVLAKLIMLPAMNYWTTHDFCLQDIILKVCQRLKALRLIVIACETVIDHYKFRPE